MAQSKKRNTQPREFKIRNVAVSDVDGRKLSFAVRDSKDRELLRKSRIGPSTALREPTMGILSHRPRIRDTEYATYIDCWLKRIWRGPTDGGTDNPFWTITVRESTQPHLPEPYVVIRIAKSGITPEQKQRARRPSRASTAGMRP